MVVDDFNVVGASVLPSETDAPLPVYSNAFLPGPVATKVLQIVARRVLKVFHRLGGIDLAQLAQGPILFIPRQPARNLAVPDLLRLLAGKTLNQAYV